MRRNRNRAERGEGLIEFVFYLALAGGVMAAAGYFLVYANQDKRLSYEQQAYVIAVATQRADAYIRAVATLQASAPPPAAQASAPPQVAPPPQAPPPQAPTAAAPAPTVYVPPQPAPTPAPPPPPAPTAPPVRTKPPMATCVGYMVGITQDGIDACQQVIAAAGTDAAIRNCISDIIGGTATTGSGPADCTQAALHAGDGNLSDCFLGLSGQSLYGRMSCRQYYGSQ
jgi:hypothetical protein